MIKFRVIVALNTPIDPTIIGFAWLISIRLTRPITIIDVFAINRIITFNV